MTNDELFQLMLENPAGQRKFLEQLISMGKLAMSRPVESLVDADVDIVFRKVWEAAQAEKPSEFQVECQEGKLI